MAEEEHKQPIIIIKRIKKVKGGHHGGSWKIAYADFVTAMMAFFLLMWLLSLMNKYELQGISNYFKKPLSAAFVKQADSIEKQNGTPYKPVKGEDMNGGSGENTKELEKAEAQQMKEDMEKHLSENKSMSEYKNMLNFKVTEDGLEIEMKELKGKPMFSNGKIDFQQYSQHVIKWISDELNHYPNRVMVVGHTDNRRFHNGDDNYTNWELSADRANAARRELVKNGMKAEKIILISGMADKDGLNNKPGEDSSNRRIGIVVLTQQAVERILSNN